MRRVMAVAGVCGLMAGMLVLRAAPAMACSCRAGVLVADALAESDAAFVGTLTGIDDPLAQGDIVSSGRPVVNHFLVERAVKGDIGERVDVEAAASGASCGLELEVGERAGLFLQWSGTAWRSSLCSTTEPAGLLAFAPAEEGPSGSSERGFFIAAGVLALAVPLAVAVHRRLSAGAGPAAPRA